MEVLFTLDEIKTAASECWNWVNNRKVVAFYGQIGTGKTTFIHALCDIKQVKDVVSSPTYSIINEYESSEGPIFHIDLYRLKNTTEAIQAGVEECLYSGNICLVEWPQRAASIFPDDTVKVYMEVISEKGRRIRIVDN